MSQTPVHTRRYSAFVSYRHADNTQEGRRWAEWLHRALERYVVPPDLIGTPNLRGEPIRDSLYPIFRDEDELSANADLATGIHAALELSDHLIVLCSPRSAVSPWVRKEVREFKELGRSDRILAIIIAGEPNADDPAKARDGILRDEECFCEELRFGVVRPDGTLDWTARTEPTAADLRPSGTRAEGFVTAEAYREYLTLNSSLTPEQISSRADAYRQQLDHGLFKIAAGMIGVPLGQLIDRDAVRRAELSKKELQRVEAEAARLLQFNRRLKVAASIICSLSLIASWFWWRATKSEKLANTRLQTAEQSRDAAEDTISEAVVGMREKLLPIGKIGLLEDMASAADGYFRKLPPELVSPETEKHRASLYLNRALVAAALGKDQDQERNLKDALAIVKKLESEGTDSEDLQKEAAFAGIHIGYLHHDRADTATVMLDCDQVRQRCAAWLAKSPDSVWALRYSLMAECLSVMTLVRVEQKPLEALPYLLKAKELAGQLSRLAPDSVEYHEAMGMLHYGEANVALHAKQTGPMRTAYEAAIASYTKAIELGGNSALVQELRAGSMFGLGAQLWSLGSATRDTDLIARARELQSQALEERKRLVALEPDRVDWWRDLAWSYGAMANIAQSTDKDLPAALAHTQESLKCRQRAISRNTNRPLLYYELSMTLGSLGNIEARQTPPDFHSAFQHLLESISTWLDVYQKTHANVSGYTLDRRLDAFLTVVNLAPKAGDSALAEAVSAMGEGKKLLERALSQGGTPDPQVQVPYLRFERERAKLLELAGKSDAAVLAGTAAKPLPAPVSNASPTSIEAQVAWCAQTVGEIESIFAKLSTLPNEQRMASGKAALEQCGKVIETMEKILLAPNRPAADHILAGQAWRCKESLQRACEPSADPGLAFAKGNSCLQQGLKLAANLPDLRLDALHQLALLEHDWGIWLRSAKRGNEAREHLRRAVDWRGQEVKMYETASGLNDLGGEWLLIGQFSRELGDWKEAEHAFSEAVKYKENATRLVPGDFRYRSPLLVASLEQLNAAFRTGGTELTTAQLDDLLSLQQKAIDEQNNPYRLKEVEIAWGPITARLSSAGRHADALRVHQAQELLRRKCISLSPDDFESQWALGYAIQLQAEDMRSLKRIDDASRLALESIRVREKLVPTESDYGYSCVRRLESAWRMLSSIYSDRKLWGDAERCAREAIAVLSKIPPGLPIRKEMGNQAYELSTELSLARVQRCSGQLEAAQSTLASLVNRSANLVTSDRTFANPGIHSAYLAILVEQIATAEAQNDNAARERALAAASTHLASWRKSAPTIPASAKNSVDAIEKASRAQ